MRSPGCTPRRLASGVPAQARDLQDRGTVGAGRLEIGLALAVEREVHHAAFGWPDSYGDGRPPAATRNVSVNPALIGQGTSLRNVDTGSPLTSAASCRTAGTDVIVTGAGFPCLCGKAAIVTAVTEAGITSEAGRGGCRETIASAMITFTPPTS